jgi:hypothetical protein
MKGIFLFILIGFLSFNTLSAQGDIKSIVLPDYKKINKGKLFVLVGWNWARYANSRIHFSGENHDFTLFKVKAQDRPSPFSADLYLNPKNISIPQTNLKVGYYFHNNWNIAFGIDHMKYVVTQLQDVRINGNIDAGSLYDGVYEDDMIRLNFGFLAFEHTDGLNFIHFELNRNDRLLKTKFFDINLTEGFSLAAIIPRSDVVLLNNAEWDKYHLAGYGTALKVALNICFFNYFQIQSEAKGGFIHLPDIQTTSSKGDKASQQFFFFQNNIQFGAIFPIVKKTKRLTKS